MSDNNIDDFSYGELDSELDLTDNYSKMLRDYVGNLPDEYKNVQTYTAMRQIKSVHGITPKEFMWLSDRVKLELLGIYQQDNTNYEE